MFKGQSYNTYYSKLRRLWSAAYLVPVLFITSVYHTKKPLILLDRKPEPKIYRFEALIICVKRSANFQMQLLRDHLNGSVFFRSNFPILSIPLSRQQRKSHLKMCFSNYTISISSVKASGREYNPV